MKIPRIIRADLFKAHLAELQRDGNLKEMPSNSIGRGRPAKVYYLDEGQVLLVCMFSRTERAADVLQQVIETQLPLPYVIAIFCRTPGRHWASSFVSKSHRRLPLP